MESKLIKLFNDLYGNGEYHAYFAPGRINLIGEHIDYNGGCVFPCALTIGTYLIARIRNDRKIRLFSANFNDGVVETDLDNLRKFDLWTDYPVGVIVSIMRNKKIMQGFDLFYYGNIPYQSGLSSSASISVATCFMLNDLFKLNYSLIDMAKICQFAENSFNGVSCGIMDQAAICLGKSDNAILLDTLTLDYEYIPIKLDGYKIVISCSNKKRELIDSKYNERHEECMEALEQLQKTHRIRNLCDLSVDDLKAVKIDEDLYKRVVHVVNEKTRVDKAVMALREGNLEQFGKLLLDSHLSLKNDYEVTGYELDTLYYEAVKCSGVLGTRMTGAGFGGCTISIVKEEAVNDFIENVSKNYLGKIGYKADFFQVDIGDGVRKIDDEILCKSIKSLINYGIENSLITEDDIDYSINQIISIFGLKEYRDYGYYSEPFEDVLESFCLSAISKGVIDDLMTSTKDVFTTKIMNCITPRPSEVIERFFDKYRISPKEATDYFYKLSVATNYIPMARIKKDIKWKFNSSFGEWDITINLAKPEKDIKEILRAKEQKARDYPKCLLCKEAVGYIGDVSFPGRSTHRIIPLTLNNAKWGFQYSPYVYYEQHCIVLSYEHTPMRITRNTFVELLELTKMFPHYFFGSNADLPIVGGSILSHNHYQGGKYQLPMFFAKSKANRHVDAFNIELDILNWPVSVIRIRGSYDNVVDFSEHILNKWKTFSDDEITAFSTCEHNTITPIARMHEDKYEMNLVLRNNYTNEEFPFGVFHSHEEYHHLKKENLGIIEVAGVAILPGRLRKELDLIKAYIMYNEPMDETIQKHKAWLDEIMTRNPSFDDFDTFIHNEIGIIFEKILNDAGVFKNNVEGFKRFNRFIDCL